MSLCSRVFVRWSSTEVSQSAVLFTLRQVSLMKEPLGSFYGEECEERWGGYKDWTLRGCIPITGFWAKTVWCWIQTVRSVSAPVALGLGYFHTGMSSETLWWEVELTRVDPEGQLDFRLGPWWILDCTLLRYEEAYCTCYLNNDSFLLAVHVLIVWVCARWNIYLCLHSDCFHWTEWLCGVDCGFDFIISCLAGDKVHEILIFLVAQFRESTFPFHLPKAVGFYSSFIKAFLKVNGHESFNYRFNVA